VLSVVRSPLRKSFAGTGDAVALIGSAGASLELVEGSVLAASLTPSPLNASDGSMILAESLMVVVVPRGRNEPEIGEPVVSVVSVPVVDFVPGRDRSACSFPEPSVFKLLMELPASVLSPLSIPATI
jgi:hypothetical protein